MKIHISTPGDYEVGISGGAATVEVDCLDFDDGDERDHVRSLLSEAFGQIFDDVASVRFDDECPDCGRRAGHVVGCPQSQAAGGEE